MLSVLAMLLLLLQSEGFVFLIHKIWAAVMLEVAILFVLFHGAGAGRALRWCCLYALTLYPPSRPLLIYFSPHSPSQILQGLSNVTILVWASAVDRLMNLTYWMTYGRKYLPLTWNEIKLGRYLGTRKESYDYVIKAHCSVYCTVFRLMTHLFEIQDNWPKKWT